MDINSLLDMSQWPVWVLPALVAGVVVVMFLLYLVSRPNPLPPLKQPVIEKQADRRDQRSTLRRTGNPIDVIVSDGESKAYPQHGMVLDRSARGMCLSLDSPYKVGSVITVKRTNNSTPWIKLTVKNCRLVGANYEVGCEFVMIPSASTLMMFG